MEKKSSPVLAAAKKIFPRLQALRRQIHRCPELGFKETATSALVARTLRQAGWAVTTGLAETGVMGLLVGRHPGPTLALRADMDALPIQEQSRAPYASRVAGVMHACGHDGNTAMLLGVALLLPRWQDRWQGQVKVLFQPCEETPPGGAQRLVAAGVLKAPRVDAILAAHIDPILATGNIALKAGPMMAAADKFTLRIQGRGGHGAMPHRCIDAVAVAGQVITNLQHLVARETNPVEPAVLTIGSIHGGSAYNVIADSVELQGTLRSLNPRVRQQLLRGVKTISAQVCRAHRAQSQFCLEAGHPALVNHAQVTDWVAVAARKIVGPRGVHWMEHPLMSGEDFTYFAARVPACFYWVGARMPGQAQPAAWHHPAFDFNEGALAIGTAVMAQSALDFLKTGV